MFTKRDRNEIRKIRHERVRKKISGTPVMPRLSVYRSLNNIYVQVIDDVAGKTLVSCSTLDPQIKGQLSELDKKGAGKLVGKTVAGRALQGQGHRHGRLRPRRLRLHRPRGGGRRRRP